MLAATLIDARRAAGLGVSGVLEPVIEARPAAREPERGRDQPVGEPGVLGEQRTVQVGADHVAAADALVAAVPVVAVPLQDASQGRSRARAWSVRRGSQTRPAPAAGPARAPPRWPRCRSGEGLGCEPSRGRSARPRAASPRPAGRSARAAGSRRTPRAPRLRDAAAACRSSRLDSPRSIGTAPGHGPGRHPCRRGRRRQGQAARPDRRREGRSRVPATAALLEQAQVAAVGVDVHQVRIQRAHAQLALRHRASPPGCRRGPRWRVSRSVALAVQARPPAPRLRAARADLVEADAVTLVLRGAVGGHDLRSALEHEAVSRSARTAVGRLE